MNKKLHLVSNAHIDPVWHWEWEEGAAEAISTYRTAAELCGEFGGYIFCHNEAQLYMWIAEYAPVLFEKIQSLVKQGKWHIMGGWYNQPDCNMPCGEAFVRQALFGRRYFKENFDSTPTTAINFDPFGHSRGLVQILAKSGYDSYLFFRPEDTVACPLPAENFTWIGYDGSTVTGRRVLSWYGSNLGKAAEKVDRILGETPDGGLNICLWGVGNHGGGPSRKDLQDISDFIAKVAADGDTVVHSTPEEFFDELRSRTALPEHRGDLNPRFPGCYTSQIRIKQLYRKMENMLFMTEKMCVHANMLGMAYPEQDLREAVKDMLVAEFHDTLPGTSVQPVEESAIRSLSHGLEILSRLRARAFFKLAENLSPVKVDEIPIVAYNPHPYAVESVFACEFNLWDANYEDVFFNPTVYYQGQALLTQAEKEHSNIPIQWRKRVVFQGRMAAASINFFTCKFERLSKKPDVMLKEKNGHFIFKNDRMEIIINATTGHIDSLKVGERKILSDKSFEIAVFEDSLDPWYMDLYEWKKIIGTFTLLSSEKGSKYSGVDKIIPSVRVIEDGDVRTVVEAVFGYDDSFAQIRYLLPKAGTSFDIELRINNAEKKKLFKLMLPAAFKNGVCEGETVFGRESLPTTGRENVSQRYLSLCNDELGFSVANDTIYGSSCKNDKLMLSLLRSPAFTAHPVEDRDVMLQDRFSPYNDQGERLYFFRVTAGTSAEVKAKRYFDATLLNQPVYCLYFYPGGKGAETSCAIQVSATDMSGRPLQDGAVEISAFKKAEFTEDYIVRLFNHSGETVQCELNIPLLKISHRLNLSAFEAETFRVKMDECSAVNMMEGEKTIT